MDKEIIETTITTEFIKLDSLLKFSGLTDTGALPRSLYKTVRYASTERYAP